MAKKKKRKKPTKRRKKSQSSFPDRRLLEPVLRDMVGFSSNSALDQAQDLVYEAIDSSDPEHGVALARQALEISADCADAYVLLAENTRRSDDTIELYREGVAAGRRALGNDLFENEAGHFWLMIETRPFMRALMGLAQSLRVVGRRDEAVDAFREILRLNPGDNQGARWVLASCLLEMGRNDELGQLLETYREETFATWTYSKTLLMFRTEGDSREAQARLAAAIESNPHVPPLLLGDSMLPLQPPDLFTPGDENEAIFYAADFLSSWKSTPGAISWLRKRTKAGLPTVEEQPETLAQALNSLMPLDRHEGEVWQIDIQRLPKAVEVDGKKVRGWLTLVVNAETGELPVMDLSEHRPGDEEICDVLIRAMRSPMGDEPHLPGEIQASTKKRCKAWQRDLKELDIACTYCKPLEGVEQAMQRLEPILAASGVAPASQEAESLPDLVGLPQEVAETWQADILLLDTWVESDGEPTRPWIILVADATNHLILGHDLTTTQPDLDALWEKLTVAMQTAMIGGSHRPAEIQVRSEDHRGVLGPRLADIGIRCTVSDELHELDEAFASLCEHMSGGSSIPALVEVPGMEPKQVGHFFEAAAYFFQNAPWSHLPGDTVIRIECDKFDSSPWFAVVMGQSGITLGLAMYDDRATLELLITGRLSEEDASSQTSGLSVTFDEEFNMAIPDLEAAEQFGWPVATPEAYPCAMRVDPGRTVRPPLASELELLSGCLRAIPPFVAKNPTQPQPIDVPIDSGSQQYVLSWDSRRTG